MISSFEGKTPQKILVEYSSFLFSEKFHVEKFETYTFIGVKIAPDFEQEDYVCHAGHFDEFRIKSVRSRVFSLYYDFEIL